MSDRTPPDLARCQTNRPCTWPHMPSFMTLGPVSYERCVNAPTWLASDGVGQMSLCDECKGVLAGLAVESVTFTSIERKAAHA